MSKYVESVAIVKGKTEEIFIKDILQPYLANKSIFITPILGQAPGNMLSPLKIR